MSRKQPKVYTHRWTINMSNRCTMSGQASSEILAIKAAKSACPTRPRYNGETVRIGDIIVERIGA